MSCKYAPWIFFMICTVAGVEILPDKKHHCYKPNKGNINRLLKLGKSVPKPPSSAGPSTQPGSSAPDIPSSSHGPSRSQGLPPSSGKKKSFLNFLSQGLFACFNVGKHNANKLYEQEKMLLKIDARQKELMDKYELPHSPIHEVQDYPPPPTFYNPWEEFGEAGMMYGYGAPHGDFDDTVFGGDGIEEEPVPPPTTTHFVDDEEDDE